MDYVTLFLMAIGMCMDAMVIAMCKGLAIRQVTVRAAAIIGIWFGVFHFIMPIIGYFCGDLVHQYIEDYDHWIIFAVMLYIGVSLIREALSGEEKPMDRELSPKVMLPLSIAVSLDALGAGMAFAVKDIDLVWGPFTLGLMAGSLSFAGMFIGGKFGTKAGKYAGILGGVILIGVGCLVVYDHMFNGA